MGRFPTKEHLMNTVRRPQYVPTKAVVEEQTICCGHKRCPHVVRYEDGSLTITDDDAVIEFDANQAKALREMLTRTQA
jgi:hypothetical protein